MLPRFSTASQLHACSLVKCREAHEADTDVRVGTTVLASFAIAQPNAARKKGKKQNKDSVVHMLGLVRQLVAVPDKLKAKKQVYTSVSRMDDKATSFAFPYAQVSVPLGGQEVVATHVSEKPEYYPVAGAQNLVAPGRGRDTDDKDEEANTQTCRQTSEQECSSYTVPLCCTEWM